MTFYLTKSISVCVDQIKPVISACITTSVVYFLARYSLGIIKTAFLYMALSIYSLISFASTSNLNIQWKTVQSKERQTQNKSQIIVMEQINFNEL